MMRRRPHSAPVQFQMDIQTLNIVIFAAVLQRAMAMRETRVMGIGTKFKLTHRRGRMPHVHIRTYRHTALGAA